QIYKFKFITIRVGFFCGKGNFVLNKQKLSLWIKLFLLILYFVDNFVLYFIHSLRINLSTPAF
ncbi:MAG TPA: hypothetical protein DCE70_03115, partial [Acinetobacter sp.]|nr:hypothetical protein [Acinetobacter sp.]